MRLEGYFPSSLLKCAPGGIRTPDTFVRSEVLYPLSYRRMRDRTSLGTIDFFVSRNAHFCGPKGIRTLNPLHAMQVRYHCAIGPYFCGPEEIRTPDLCNANATLYQLSYWPLPLWSRAHYTMQKDRLESYYLKYESGFWVTLLRLISKCKCGPVELPVFPESPITV